MRQSVCITPCIARLLVIAVSTDAAGCPVGYSGRFNAPGLADESTNGRCVTRPTHLLIHSIPRARFSTHLNTAWQNLCAAAAAESGSTLKTAQSRQSLTEDRTPWLHLLSAAGGESQSGKMNASCHSADSVDITDSDSTNLLHSLISPLRGICYRVLPHKDCLRVWHVNNVVNLTPTNPQNVISLPKFSSSVLRHCWLGDRTGIQQVGIISHRHTKVLLWKSAIRLFCCSVDFRHTQLY